MAAKRQAAGRAKRRAAKADSRTKRERFLPYAYERSGLTTHIESVRLDGITSDAVLDTDRHLVVLDDAIWKEAHIDVKMTMHDTLLSRVLPEAERAEPPVAIVGVLRCSATRFRARAFELSPTGSGLATITLHRDQVHGAVDLSALLVRTRDTDLRTPGFATVAGARLAAARTWELRLEKQRVVGGQFLDIRYCSFRGDDVLQPFAGNLYRLELDQASPVLWINADQERITPILGDRGTTGKRARLREVFYDLIAQGVWTQMFLRAAEDLRTDGELTYDWEDAALRELLPSMFPELRSHALRVSALGRSLRSDGLSVTVERLDAALQRKNDISLHMTRLIDDTIEA